MDSAPRYVLSARAADALRALIQPGSSTGFRRRRISDVSAHSEDPLPFDCDIRVPEGGTAQHLFIHLPNDGAPLVVYHGMPLDPARGQSIGIHTNPWVDVGAITTMQTRFVYVVFHVDSQNIVDGWQVVDTATEWEPPTGTGAMAAPPQILIAVYDIDPTAEPGGRNGLFQYFHGLLEVGGPEVLDTDVIPETPPGKYPGESVNRWNQNDGPPDTSLPLQLRQFHDPNDTQIVKPIGAGSQYAETTPDATNLQILARKIGPRTTADDELRPKLAYIPAGAGLFWITGGDDTTNYGTSIRLGSEQAGYVTITVSAS